MSIIRRDPILRKDKGGAFAKGKKAIAICQRSGFKYKQSDMVFEPGTNYFVHRSESDGAHNLVTDDLNFPSPRLKEPEGGTLRYVSPDVALSVGVIVTPTSLALVGDVSVNSFYAYPGASETTTE